MKIIAANALGYERELEIILGSLVIYCTATVFNKYADVPCVDTEILNATVKDDSFNIEYSVLLQNLDVMFEQPVVRSPSTILSGVCIERVEDYLFLISNDLLGVVSVSFEKSTDLSVGERVSLRGELCVDSDYIVSV